MNTNTGSEAGNKAFEAMTPLLKAGEGGSETNHVRCYVSGGGG